MYENSFINEKMYDYDFIENLNGYNLINDEIDRECETPFAECDEDGKIG